MATLPISVIIPAYQAATLIERALAGISEQTFAPAEVIVVDDGSTDYTGDIAKRAGATVVRQRNSGVSSARNTGIRAATQPWIAFLDADDRWFPDKLAAQWAVVERQPQARLILSDYAIVRAGAGTDPSALAILPHYRRAARTRLGDDAVWIARDEFRRTVIQTNMVGPSCVMIQRDWLLANDLWYAEDLPAGEDFFVAEDLEWILRVLRHGDVFVVERALSDYLVHPQSRSAQRGRQAYGDVVLGELIAAAPERYAAGSAADFKRLRPFHLRRAALEYIRHGEYGAARAVLRQAWVERPSFRAAAMLGLATLGESRLGHLAIERGRALWRARSRAFSASSLLH